jgi:alkaline phosphatase D
MTLRSVLVLALAVVTACASPVPQAEPQPQVAAGGEIVAEPAPPPLPPAPPAPPPPTRIAFGSCNDLRTPQVLWERIASLQPTAFVWLGDIVYADTQDISLMRKLYDELKTLPAYTAMAAATRVIGTWDDHDYGGDDAGKEYPMRTESQKALLDFLDEPEDSPRRQQEGVYASVDFGQDPYRVRVILLDTRYHRDRPGPAGDILGEQQWAWLRAQLAASTAAVHILASSIQVVPEQHGFEKWASFPSARAKLLAMIDELAPRNLVIISGDRHFAELSRLERGPGKTPLYDVTSSSLSKPWTKPPQELNRHRVGDIVWEVNFGVIEIAWAAPTPVMHLQVHGRSGAVAINAPVPLAPAMTSTATLTQSPPP